MLPINAVPVYQQLPTREPDVESNLKKAAHFMERTSHKSESSLCSQLSQRLFELLKNEMFLRIMTAIFYACTSFLIIVVNKIILTTYKFPSSQVLGIGQMLATILVLGIGKTFEFISFPGLSRSLPRKIFPMPLFYLGNLVFGLSGTQKISLPMFTVLRRFGILMTVIAEYWILNITQTRTIMATVWAMIIGAIIAAIDDLSFNAVGYAMVLGNNLCSAANGVYIKKKLDSKQLGKYGLMYYNSLFMLPFLICLTWISGDFTIVRNFSHYKDWGFIISFLSSCFMGFLLMYSTVLCTMYNSALTTTVIGCLKNILVTFVGMYIGGDYVFSFANFIGLNISMIASIVYSYVTFVQNPKPVSS